jgi:hypothetical protein
LIVDSAKKISSTLSASSPEGVVNIKTVSIIL